MKLTLVIVALFVSMHAVGQTGGNDRSSLKAEPPEIRAKRDQVSNLIKAAESLAKDRKFDEAIGLHQEAVVLQATLPGFSSGVHYSYATTLGAAGRYSEAAEAFRSAVAWTLESREQSSDLYVNGPVLCRVLLDYALVLLKLDRLDDAKAIYYGALRALPSVELPSVYPFLVVFDPEPGLTVWPLTKPRLEAALLMLKHQGTHEKDGLAELDRIQAAAPEWILPAFVRALSFKNRDAKIAEVDKVYLMASTEEEQGWIDRWRQYIKLEPKSAQEVMDWMAQHEVISEYFKGITKQRLKSSTVLEAARVAMEKNPLRLVGRIVD